MTKDSVDFEAVARISRRVDLKAIQLTEINATRKSSASGVLQPSFEKECTPRRVEDDLIEVACSYSFKVRSADSDVAAATILYLVTYKLLGEEPADESDIEQFARANGAYHSWPFVREVIYSLTSKMGFSPYTLPVLSFLPKPRPRQELPPDVVPDTPSADPKPSPSTTTNRG